MKIQFYGAARTVTGSMHLIEINGSKILLDCGLFQGKRKESFERNRSFPFDAKTIDAVILSHAHIDHSGNLPHLMKAGFRGRIYATPATVHLSSIMLLDSGHIQERQADFINLRNRERHLPPVDALYTQVDAMEVLPYFTPIKLDTPFEPANGVTARFVEAGHILGSAAIDLTLEERGKKTRLWFSGDIGRRDLPIIRDPIFPVQTDYLLMESTYGDKPHRSPEEAYQEMKTVIGRALDKGGKVIIPAFAVGRTQELIYNLNRMKEERALDATPVYIDSPLAINVTEIFKKHPECYDDETRAQIEAGHPALEFENIRYIHSVEESKELNYSRDAAIVISASGMAEVGRVVHHIKFAVENPRNTILIVSWQAPETLGRRLADREKKVNIYGEQYRVAADVETIGGLSAHADGNTLVEYAMGVKQSAKKVFVVHGEERGALPLIDRLKDGGMRSVHYPERGTSFEL